ncbi:hypothetical protein HMPREF1248_1564 [Coriobacteriaceae bacterium BV3Ac1]|nr:hypothetical protein HMPREF1248_1564 [Coriobacteriaceae bacterium BV3Ac1]
MNRLGLRAGNNPEALPGLSGGAALELVAREVLCIRHLPCHRYPSIR